MTNDEVNALRLLIREEVGSAVYASEQRINVRLDRIEANVSKLQVDVSKLQVDYAALRADVTTLRVDVSKLRADVTKLQVDYAALRVDVAKIKEDTARLEANLAKAEGDLIQLITVLDEASMAINDMQRSQMNLENKQDENYLRLWQNSQKMAGVIQQFGETISRALKAFAEHKKTPLDLAHPQPHSAA